MTGHWGVLDFWPDPLYLVFCWHEYLMGIITADNSDRKDCQVWMRIEIKNAFFFLHCVLSLDFHVQLGIGVYP